MELVKAHAMTPVRSLSEARPGLRVLPALDSLLQQAMAKDAAQRWTQAGQLLQALQDLPRPATQRV